MAVLTGLFLLMWYVSPSAQKFASFADAPYYELFGWLLVAGVTT